MRMPQPTGASKLASGGTYANFRVKALLLLVLVFGSVGHSKVPGEFEAVPGTQAPSVVSVDAVTCGGDETKNFWLGTC